MTEKFYTDYQTAANWETSLILCNNITEIDANIFENFRFNLDDEEEIYQYYLTDLSENGVEYAEETFNLYYTYSEKLDLFVLCVPHFGTSWDYVECEVKSKGWIDFNRDKEYRN